MNRTHTGNEGNRNEGGDLLYGLIVQRSILHQAITVGNTPTAIPTTPIQYRKSMYIFNNSANIIYVGDASVDVASGFPLYPRASLNVQIEDSVTVYAISVAGGDEIRILEGS